MYLVYVRVWWNKRRVSSVFPGVTRHRGAVSYLFILIHARQAQGRWMETRSRLHDSYCDRLVGEEERGERGGGARWRVVWTRLDSLNFLWVWASCRLAARLGWPSADSSQISISSPPLPLAPLSCFLFLPTFCLLLGSQRMEVPESQDHREKQHPGLISG
jgi:hypothetical protein